jgi:teichuronic acid biosynthesis glycosyltransferase TuaH
MVMGLPVKKILYLMSIPWGWIKQRPHFIAEELSKYYDVEVFYQIGFRFKSLVANQVQEDITIHPVFRLPLMYSAFSRFFNAILLRWQLKNAIQKCQVVWFTDPILYFALHAIIPSDSVVIYDCMDNFLEFPKIKANDRLSELYLLSESDLFKRANYVYASSSYLADQLTQRYGQSVSSKLQIVNNGICLPKNSDQACFCTPDFKSKYQEFFIYSKQSGITGRLQGGSARSVYMIHESASDAANNPVNLSEKSIATYIGTIAPWFDFNLVLKSLKDCPNLVCCLFGPTEVAIPKHERLLYLGPVAHECIFAIMQESNILLMPFTVTNLIQAVNPVKLYEYIYSGKPVLAVEYAESGKFKDYVYLYKNQDEYCNYLSMLCRGQLLPKKSKEECLEFAQANTWSARVQQIKQTLDAGRV